jgi:phytoene desaturase (3,4-didehydrolycopene-forming)
LLKCEPNYNLWFGDGESFELSTDTARMKLEVEKWEGIDGFERYLGFLQEAHRHYEQSIIHVLRKNFKNLFHMARPSFLRYLFTLHPFESIYYRASKYFYTERLRRVFTFGSMYMGMSPFDAPGTYSLLQYTELAEGIWYPKGGFHVVLDKLVKIGQRMGVEYRLSTDVAAINLSSNGKRVEGVRLSSGEDLSADIVVVNADLVYAYNNLLPTSAKAKSLSQKPVSCSSISFYWALDKQVPELTAHNIFLADDYKDSFDDIFKRQLIPQEPSFYVNVPSRVDPTAAPAGKDTVVVLVPVGHLVDKHAAGGTKSTSEQNWQAMINMARSKVLDTIEGRTGAKMRHAILHEEINTPGSWKEKFNLDKGAILGLSHSFFNVLSFRPSTKHAKYEDLYFVGASTHPGTGVPICLAGSKIVTEQILDHIRVAVPWTRNGDQVQGPQRKAGKAGIKDIDRIQNGPGLYSLAMVILALLLTWLFMRVMGGR